MMRSGFLSLRSAGPLTRLADFMMAPYQPWVSDRSVRFRPTMRHSLRTRRGKAAR